MRKNLKFRDFTEAEIYKERQDAFRNNIDDWQEFYIDSFTRGYIQL